MKISKVIVAPMLAFMLVGTAACQTTPRSVLVCAENEVLEVDEDGEECEPDENGNGIDDENEGEEGSEVEESDKKKSKKKSRSTTRRKR